MITVTEALDALFTLVEPLGCETVPLQDAAGRVLAQDVAARRDQPPFAASAMDGYAIASDSPASGDSFTVIGESAAGHGFDGEVGAGQAIRIFTGAPVPYSCERVVIQEDVARDGDAITIGDRLDQKMHIRPSGGDFKAGDTIKAPRLLGPADVALLASMNMGEVPVARRPSIALIATGDELVMPGETPSPDQIIASNTFGLKALFEAAGAIVRMLPIAKDNEASLGAVLDMAAGNDLIITIGGASVGDYDIVGKVAATMGLERSFYKVAMRPGKPLMAGRLGDTALIGLPGNPVSSMVCGEIFILPVIAKMLGLGVEPRGRKTAPLADALPKNGPREHYMRAVRDEETGEISAFDRQDSSLLTVLADANVLVVRPPDDPARNAGDDVAYIAL